MTFWSILGSRYFFPNKISLASNSSVCNFLKRFCFQASPVPWKQNRATLHKNVLNWIQVIESFFTKLVLSNSLPLARGQNFTIFVGGQGSFVYCVESTWNWVIWRWVDVSPRKNAHLFFHSGSHLGKKFPFHPKYEN